MRKTVCFVLLSMSACATGAGDDNVNPPLSPVDPEPPVVTPVEPPDDIDGEYVMRIEPVSSVCNGEAYDEPVLYALANVVEQNNRTTFDVTARGIGGFYDFSHWGIERNVDGYFDDVDSFEWYITPGYPPAIFLINAVGSIVADTLAFSNHWTVGWYDTSGVWHGECDMVYDNIGARRYSNWDGTPRQTIDGQWRVWHQRLDDSPTDPEVPNYQVIDVIAQNNDESMFDLKWARFSLKNVPRSADGSVNYSVWSDYNQFSVSGVVTNDSLDLILTWDQYSSVSGEVFWHVRDRYTGVPRFQPHQVGTSEPPTGAYNLEMVQTADTCDFTLDTKRYVFESFAVDNNQVQLWFAGLKPQPFAPDADGAFNLSFGRSDGWHYSYLLENGEINGDTVTFTLHAEAIWPEGYDELTGQIYCYSDYVGNGVKRYSNRFPGEQ